MGDRGGYSAPTLVVIGDVEALTAGSTGTSTDGQGSVLEEGK